MTAFNSASYGPVFESLLAIDRCRALDAGEPNQAALAELERLTLKSAFAHARVVDTEMAPCCLAGVWLVHDFLDRSHTISQGIETPSGSFWHGIMHRREGDYGNAKYWFRRMGEHAVFEPLARRAAELAIEHGERAPQFVDGDQWEPFAYVDACQRAVRSGTGAELCRAAQQAEWELLFDHCYRSAIGLVRDGRGPNGAS